MINSKSEFATGLKNQNFSFKFLNFFFHFTGIWTILFEFTDKLFQHHNVSLMLKQTCNQVFSFLHWLDFKFKLTVGYSNKTHKSIIFIRKTSENVMIFVMFFGGWQKKSCKSCRSCRSYFLLLTTHYSHLTIHALRLTHYPSRLTLNDLKPVTWD